MGRLDTKAFGLKKTSRIKAFVFKFISVPAKWIRTARHYQLNIYTDNKSYQALDIVVRDDCSTDATRSILHDYEQKSGRITVIEGDNVGCARSFWFAII